MQTRQTAAHKPYPLGEPGQIATYHHESEGSLPNAVVKTLTVSIGSVEEVAGVLYQWLCLQITKVTGEKFVIWLLSESVPSEDLKVARTTTSRYVLQIEDDPPLEFRDKFTGKPVLPSLGAWQYLFPKPADKEAQNNLFPQTVKYLGHTYRLALKHFSRELSVLERTKAFIFSLTLGPKVWYNESIRLETDSV